MLAGAIAAVGVVVVLVSIWRVNGGQTNGQAVTQAYYSDDDGKSWFANAVGKPTPFDHNGKPAYQAFVFRCLSSKQFFVGYLLRKDPLSQIPIKSTVDAAKAAPGQTEPAGTQVKKPGSDEWVPEGSPLAQTIVQAACPDGGRAVLVLPGG